MPGKMARSAPRPPFGLPEVAVAVRSSRLSCRKAGKREYSRQFGSHPGNPGSSGNSGLDLGPRRFQCRLSVGYRARHGIEMVDHMFVAGVANLTPAPSREFGVIFGFVAKWIVSGCVNVRWRKS